MPTIKVLYKERYRKHAAKHVTPPKIYGLPKDMIVEEAYTDEAGQVLKDGEKREYMLVRCYLKTTEIGQG